MIATISWWNLTESTQTIESLRQYLNDEGVAPWEAIQGMRSKFWMSDPDKNLWGAVVVWNSPEFLTQPLPPNRATELIGYPPTWRTTFDVEVLIDQGVIVSTAMHSPPPNSQPIAVDNHLENAL
ncbi:hypothetical protein [Dyella sp. GSA-30]|uniref:hypothetical protein n=1 Tax=Dyella sp. GSA-30 TaxID=2994496 RepID=UPI0024906B75|nr:hypothetical protein [Dyella sp. GSA-30]BDU21156.1 hypothetical protein DYGSA30_26130 [Dyella sp. GSA-30]